MFAEARNHAASEQVTTIDFVQATAEQPAPLDERSLLGLAG
jgi:hypothetical protein